MKNLYDHPMFERSHASSRIKRDRLKLADILYQKEKEFQCIHCHNTVLSDPVLSGVANRNHCPYCLWSRHLDQFKAGDRLAACKAPMKPVGLTQKRIKKKYGEERRGELMLVHQCVECGKVSINRIAADDDAERIAEVFENSLQTDISWITRLEEDGIRVLDMEDSYPLQVQLFGHPQVLG